MRIDAHRPLFPWECLDDCPDIKTIRQLIQLIPDGPLLEALQRRRGKGRDDFPIRVLWGVVVLKPLLRHTSYQQVLDELHRNPAMAELIGICFGQPVPDQWNISRFLNVLGMPEHLELMRQAFNGLIQNLGRLVPDLGRRTAGDFTGLAGLPGNRQALREFLAESILRHQRASGSGRPVAAGTLDIDPMPIEVHGDQPGAAWHGHYHAKIYGQLLCRGHLRSQPLGRGIPARGPSPQQLRRGRGGRAVRARDDPQVPRPGLPAATRMGPSIVGRVS